MSTVAKLKPLGRNGRPAIIPPVPVRRFTVAEYHRMIDDGILGPNDAVELLEGWIVPKMSPRKPPHDGTIDVVGGEIEEVLPEDWFIRSQSASTTRDSEPEPDLTVVRGPRGRYLKRHPTPADVAMMVEVSDTTLRHDRGFKGRVYARARIPVYWIVNLREEQVEVYTDPSGPGRNPHYTKRRDYKVGESVPVVIRNRVVGRIPIARIFPK